MGTTRVVLGDDPAEGVTVIDQQRTRAKHIAPYITAWSAEQDLPYRLIERTGYGVGYADELLTDRDSRGVLWQRAAVCRQVGRPEFGRVHPLRQRRAMLRLLCQVCAGPADQTNDGVLWLLRDHRDDWPGWPEGMASVEPPICMSCVGLSVKLCPALRRGAVAVRAREFPIVGVRGALYRGGVSAPVAVEAANLSYDDPVVRWVVASALVRELHDCSVVPIAELTRTRVRMDRSMTWREARWTSSRTCSPDLSCSK